MGEEAQEEAHDDEIDEQDERMFLTHQYQEILLQQLGGNEKGYEVETKISFEKEVSEKLEKIARQKQPDPYQILQASLGQQVAQIQQSSPTHPDQQEHQEEEQEQNVEAHRITVDVTMQGGEQDDSMPRWLNFTFKKKSKVILLDITLQEAIIEFARRIKRVRMIHHLSKMDSGDVITDIVVPVKMLKVQPKLPLGTKCRRLTWVNKLSGGTLILYLLPFPLSKQGWGNNRKIRQRLRHN